MDGVRAFHPHSAPGRIDWRPGSATSGTRSCRRYSARQDRSASACRCSSTRSPGRCIETVAWESLDVARRDQLVRPVANRAAELLGSTLMSRVEVAVLHRDHGSSSGACVTPS